MTEHYTLLHRRHCLLAPTEGIHDPRQRLPCFYNITRGRQKTDDARLGTVGLV